MPIAEEHDALSQSTAAGSGGLRSAHPPSGCHPTGGPSNATAYNRSVEAEERGVGAGIGGSLATLTFAHGSNPNAVDLTLARGAMDCATPPSGGATIGSNANPIACGLSAFEGKEGGSDSFPRGGRLGRSTVPVTEPFASTGDDDGDDVVVSAEPPVPSELPLSSAQGEGEGPPPGRLLQSPGPSPPPACRPRSGTGADVHSLSLSLIKRADESMAAVDDEASRDHSSRPPATGSAREASGDGDGLFVMGGRTSTDLESPSGGGGVVFDS